MTSAMGSTLPWVSILLIACMAVSSSVAAVAPNGGQLFGQINRIPASSIPSSQLQQQFLVFRGGAASDEYDSDEYDSEYDSDEEEEELTISYNPALQPAKGCITKHRKQWPNRPVSPPAVSFVPAAQCLLYRAVSSTCE